MNKKVISVALSGMLLALSLRAQAQQATKVPRIGFLSNLSAGPYSVEPFRQGLRELGYVEGQNIIIEYRWGEGKADRLPELAAELVRNNVDVIVAPTSQAARGARQVTTTIPIVMAVAGDLTGLVASLARPGGNVTGLTGVAPELSGKRLELFKEVSPRISRVAALWHISSQNSASFFKETEVAAQTLGLQLLSLEVREPDRDLDASFQSAAKERVDAFLVQPQPVLASHLERIIKIVAKSRLPAIYPASGFVEAGGLMSYSQNSADLYRRAAYYVDRILKGTKPADLPVEQPMKFELVINLNTAKEIGLTIPPKVLMWADKVIK